MLFASGFTPRGLASSKGEVEGGTGAATIGAGVFTK